MTSATGKTLSRDYKHVKRHSPGTAAFNGWTGLAVGLALGLSVALGVYLHFQNRAPAIPQADADASPASATASDEAPAPLPAAGDDFGFYDILPNQEVEVPDDAARTAAGRAPRPEGDITLQAGSFKQIMEAEKLQALLAQYGIAARIHRYPVDDETWYRVRIGPIATVEELEAVRSKLAEAEVEAIPVSMPAVMPPP